MRSHRRLIISIQQRGGDKSLHALIENHIRRVLPEMTSTRMINTLRITVRLVKTKLQARKANGTAGKNLKRTRGAKSKHYNICLLRDRNVEETLSTLTHELQHVVQFASGRLDYIYHRTTRIGYRTWRPVGHKGASIRFPYWDGSKAAGMEVVLIPWAERPWEIEACQAVIKHRSQINRSMKEWRRMAC